MVQIGEKQQAGNRYLFASSARDVRVHIEIRNAGREGDGYSIGDAVMTVNRKGKAPFVAGARGTRLCWTGNGFDSPL